MVSTTLLKIKYKKYNSPEYSDNIISPTFLQSQNNVYSFFGPDAEYCGTGNHINAITNM
jgi:hypothetical protein